MEDFSHTFSTHNAVGIMYTISFTVFSRISFEEVYKLKNNSMNHFTKMFW